MLTCTVHLPRGVKQQPPRRHGDYVANSGGLSWRHALASAYLPDTYPISMANNLMIHTRGAVQKRAASSQANTGCHPRRSSAEMGHAITKTAAPHNAEFASIGIHPSMSGRPAATSCRMVVVTTAISEHLAAYRREPLRVFITSELYT